MSTLIPVESARGISRRSRATSRSLNRIDRETHINLAIVESQVEIQAAKAMARSWLRTNLVG
jgi:uncharacterized protein with PIN domain